MHKKIKTAKFVKSSQKISECPVDNKPEFAFIGRSNVGKSSLINMLADHKDLAKTSSMPGKTKLINHFLINDQWYIVDLPGYGYARTSKTDREGYQKLIDNYIFKRKELFCLFVLIDSRIEPQKIDLEFIEKLGEYQVPFTIIFTKADKIGKNILDSNTSNFLNTLQEQWEEIPQYFTTSVVDKRGKTEILSYIDEVLKPGTPKS